MKFDLKKEITWAIIDTSIKEEIETNSLYKVGVKFNDLNIAINIQYDNPSYTQHIEEKFCLDKPIPRKPSIQFITSSIEQMKNVVGSHIGYLSADKRKTPFAVVYTSDFGIVKSAVCGFASFIAFKQNYHPAHAAVVSIDGTGTLLVGASGAGKTSTLLKIMSCFQNSKARVACLTDDWCIVKKQNDNYFARTFDPSISFSKKMINELSNEDIRIKNKVLSNLDDQSKMSLPIQDLYGSNGYNNNVNILRAIVLNPEPGEGKLYGITPEVFSNWVIGSAYHHPYVSKSQKDSSRAFWMSFSENYPTYVFHTRSYSSSETQKIDELIDILS